MGTLLVENKYFQGYGDAHLQTVSLNGGGNFKTDLNKLDEALTPLQLVRVYGAVVSEEGSTPVINAQYMRIWPWGEFNFQDYGEDQGDPRWKKNVSLPSGEPVYTHISPEYYIHALGPSEEQAGTIKAFAKRIEDMERARAKLPPTKKEEVKP